MRRFAILGSYLLFFHLNAFAPGLTSTLPQSLHAQTFPILHGSLRKTSSLLYLEMTCPPFKLSLPLVLPLMVLVTSHCYA